MQFTTFSPQILRDAIEIELRSCNDIKQATYAAMNNLKENPQYYSMQKARITKYIKRVKGANGKWIYTYPEDVKKNAQAKKEEPQHAAHGEFASYPSSNNPATMKKEDFIPDREYNAAISTQYRTEGGSSRTNPLRAQLGLRVGQWRMDSLNGLYGNEISQLREINFNDLIHAEDLVSRNIEGRRDDSDRYAEWIKQGKTPPPIEVIETEDGKMKIIDGHRRARAMHLAGQKVLAWVSPITDSPAGRDANGKQMKTGLTYQLAQKKTEAGADMTKARIVKYIKRVPKPSGKGYYYFYNKADYDRYRKTGAIPEGQSANPNSTITDKIMRFLGFDATIVRERIRKDFQQNNIAEKFSITSAQWFAHVNEYFEHKEYWDGYFAPKEKKDGKPKGTPKKKSPHPKGGKASDKTVSIMRQIHALYGAMKEQKKREEAKKPEPVVQQPQEPTEPAKDKVLAEPETKTSEERDTEIVKVISDATPENRAEAERIIENTPKLDFQKSFSEFLQDRTQPDKGVLNFLTSNLKNYQTINEKTQNQKNAGNTYSEASWSKRKVDEFQRLLDGYIAGSIIENKGKMIDGEAYFAQVKRYESMSDKTTEEAKALKKKITFRENKERKEHIRLISKAIEEGKIVPANVLKEYPELVAEKSKQIARPDINYTPTVIKKEIKLAGEESETRSVDLHDYSRIEPKDVFLVDEELILNTPRPSYIPDLDVRDFAGYEGKKQVFDTVKIGKDQFVIVDKRYGVNIGVDYGSHENIRKEYSKVEESKYYLFNAETMAATWDYYQKLYKMQEIKKLEDRQDREEKYYNDKKEKALADGKSWNYAPFQRKQFRGKRAKKPDISTMSASQGFFIQDFLGMKGNVESLRHGKLNITVFENYHETLKNLNYKIEDMKMQREYDDENNTYAKGEETSYGDGMLKDDLLKSHGVKIKRQNGTEIDAADATKIGMALDQLYSVFGDRSSMARNFGLKISWAGDKRMHASKSIGLFIEKKKCLAISDYSIEDRGFTLAHEFSHFIDSYLAKKNGSKYRFASDEDESTANKIAVAFRDNIELSEKVSEQSARYYMRTCECFARAMEVYYSVKQNTHETLYDRYKDTKALAPHDKFMSAVFPLIEQFFSENNEMLKAFFGETIATLKKALANRK